VSRAVLAASATAVALTGHAVANLRHLRAASDGCPVCAPTPSDVAVSVLVPVRDEAHRIGRCIEALIGALEGVDAEVLVLDDGSTDGTADIVRTAAAGDPRVRVLDGAPLPSGWLGKPHACHQLAEAARGDVLVFVDADVRLAPRGILRSVDLLVESGLDLVSPYPRQEFDGLLPRLVQPLLQWSWLTFLPLGRAERSSRPSLTAANGQLLACRADAYRRSGGHAAVRDDVVEDVGLARAFKRAGLRATVADGTDVATCRMYDDADELVEGYTKSLAAAFGSPAGAVGTMALLVWTYVVPPLALLRGLRRGDPALAAAGGAGYLAGVAGRVVAARRFGGRPGDAPTHPASVLALAWLTARSWRMRRQGTATWKGRPVVLDA
jgi:hypothetical protein